MFSFMGISSGSIIYLVTFSQVIFCYICHAKKCGTIPNKLTKAWLRSKYYFLKANSQICTSSKNKSYSKMIFMKPKNCCLILSSQFLLQFQESLRPFQSVGRNDQALQQEYRPLHRPPLPKIVGWI